MEYFHCRKENNGYDFKVKLIILRVILKQTHMVFAYFIFYLSTF